jgi:hypothetical protein
MLLYKQHSSLMRLAVWMEKPTHAAESLQAAEHCRELSVVAATGQQGPSVVVAAI